MAPRSGAVAVLVLSLFVAGCGIAYRGDGPLMAVGIRSNTKGEIEPVLGIGYQHQARRSYEYNANAHGGDPSPAYHAYNAPAYEVQARLDLAPLARTWDLVAQGSGQVIPALMGAQLVTGGGVRLDARAARWLPLLYFGVGIVGFDPRVGSHGGRGPPPPCGYSPNPDCRRMLGDYTVLLDWSARIDVVLHLLQKSAHGGTPWDLRTSGSWHRQAW